MGVGEVAVLELHPSHQSYPTLLLSLSTPQLPESIQSAAGSSTVDERTNDGCRTSLLTERRFRCPQLPQFP